MADDDNGFYEGGFENGSIKLKEVPSVYYPGQTVNGSVVFKLTRPQNFTALTIQFLGEAKVFWTEDETFVDHDEEIYREVKYQGHEEYFNHTETLAGGSYFDVSQLPDRLQNFPFKYQIPFTVPSSFKGEKGEISYTITATMVYPDMTSEELKKEFQVVAPFDLNKGNPRIKEPIEIEFDEVMSCCFSSEPLNVRIRLPFSGYCPGQVIPVAVEVDNESSVEINKIKFTIVTKELYRSRRPPSDFIIPEQELVCVKTPPVLANGKKSFPVEVQIPDMIVPYLENCSIIDIGYFFRVTIKVSGLNDPLKDDVEICLGLIPLKESLEGEYVHPMAHLLPSGPIPVYDGTSMPYTGPIGFTTSDPSIPRIHQGIPDVASNLPPPYPGNYATDNQYPGPGASKKEDSSLSDPPPPYPGIITLPNPSENTGPDPKPNPYDIGFRVYTPYPSNIKPGSSNTDDLPTSMPLPPSGSQFLPSAPSAPPADE